MDPLSRLMQMNLAYILVDAGSYDEGVRLARAVIESRPNWVSQLRNGFLHEFRAGNIEAGAAGLERWAAAEQRDVAAARDIGDLIVRYQRTGEPQKIGDELVTRLELGPEDVAQIYAFVGDGESTLVALDIALEERSGSRSVLSMNINPAYDFIRDDPRFVELLERLGFAK